MKEDITQIFPLTFTGTDGKFAIYDAIKEKWFLVVPKEVNFAKILKQL